MYLILLQLLLVYSLGMFTFVESIIRSSHAAVLARYANQDANEILNRMSRGVDELNPPCLIPVTSLLNLKTKSVHWWLQSACQLTIRQRHYYYRYESLGSDSCAELRGAYISEAVAAHYYRITLYSGNRLGWQATLAFPVQSNDLCQFKKHTVISGLQMIKRL